MVARIARLDMAAGARIFVGEMKLMFDPTRILGVYARWLRWRDRRRSAEERQLQQLRRMTALARGTRFGADHQFGSVTTPETFRERVPLRTYEDFWSEYWRDDFPTLRNVSWPGLIPYFAKTSGTSTGASKYVPYTNEMRRMAGRGMMELFRHHLLSRPDSRLFGGAAVVLSGAETLERLAPGVHAGAVSAITSMGGRRWLRGRILPPVEIARIEDWREKIRLLAPMALEAPVRGLGGSPNWMLIFLEEVARLRPESAGRLVDLFPELELVVHGGVNFAPYRARFRRLLEGGRAETREAYSASEGFYAVADRGDGDGLRLLPDVGVFYEFVPVEEMNAAEPRRFWLGEVETGVDYVLVVSTMAGLWSYVLGDTVRFLSRDPPRLIVTGRTSYQLSAVGEHLSEREIADAVSVAAAAAGVDVMDYVVTARAGVEGRAGGRHHYILDARPAPEAAAAALFRDRLDARLSELNDDYRELRENDYSLRPPELRFTRPGGLMTWMEARRGLGGQNKVPRIVRDPALFAEIETCVSAEGAGDDGA